jgi:hypothetical protein
MECREVGADCCMVRLSLMFNAAFFVECNLALVAGPKIQSLVLTHDISQARRPTSTSGESRPTLPDPRRRCFRYIPCTHGLVVIWYDATRHGSADWYKHAITRKQQRAVTGAASTSLDSRDHDIPG